MKIRHLSENEIQLYVIERAKLSEDLLTHLKSCSFCQAELSAYKVIFTDIKKLKRPAFDFDLSDLILEQIPAVKSKFLWTTYFAILMGILFFVISFTSFSNYLIHVFKALPSIQLSIIVTSSILILFFQSIEAVKIYRKKINSININ